MIWNTQEINAKFNKSNHLDRKDMVSSKYNVVFLFTFGIYIAKCFLTCSFFFDHTLVMQIMFPILENLDRANLVSANHYWLFNVNIRDRRFEVFDSWRSLAQSKTLDDNARLIAATVRSLWDQHYHESRVSLDDFRLKEIDVPKQDNE